MATHSARTRGTTSGTAIKSQRPSTPLTLYAARDAVEEFYTKRQSKEDAGEGDRSLSRAIAARYGIQDNALRTETDKLPPGLENSAVCLSLRRHCNVLLNIDDGRQQFTMEELHHAVLRSFSPGIGQIGRAHV